MEFTEQNKIERLNFAKTIQNIDLNRCVFLGGCVLDGVTLWSIITNVRESTLLIDYGGLNSGYYADFLDEEILPITNSISNLTIVHMKSRLTRSPLVKRWITDHPNINFVEWPRILEDVYPFRSIWPYFNDVEMDDETAIYDRWDLLKDDLYDFRHVYSTLRSQIRRIVWSSGNRVDDCSDGESGVEEEGDERQ